MNALNACKSDEFLYVAKVSMFEAFRLVTDHSHATDTRPIASVWPTPSTNDLLLACQASNSGGPEFLQVAERT